MKTILISPDVFWDTSMDKAPKLHVNEIIDYLKDKYKLDVYSDNHEEYVFIKGYVND